MCSQSREGAERDKSGIPSFPGGSSEAAVEVAGTDPHSRYFLRLTFLGLGHMAEESLESSTCLLSFSCTSWYRMGNCAEPVDGGRLADQGESWSMDWALSR